MRGREMICEHDLLKRSCTICFLQEEVEELRKALEWASRIIGSGLDSGAHLQYDPIAWNMKYHSEWKEQPNE